MPEEQQTITQAGVGHPSSVTVIIGNLPQAGDLNTAPTDLALKHETQNMIHPRHIPSQHVAAITVQAWLHETVNRTVFETL